jgi:hypothetical protein
MKSRHKKKSFDGDSSEGYLMLCPAKEKVARETVELDHSYSA